MYGFRSPFDSLWCLKEIIVKKNNSKEIFPRTVYRPRSGFQVQTLNFKIIMSLPENIAEE